MQLQPAGALLLRTEALVKSPAASRPHPPMLLKPALPMPGGMTSSRPGGRVAVGGRLGPAALGDLPRENPRELRDDRLRLRCQGAAKRAHRVSLPGP